MKKGKSKTIIKMYHKVFRIYFVEDEYLTYTKNVKAMQRKIKNFFTLTGSSFHPSIYYFTLSVFYCFFFSDITWFVCVSLYLHFVRKKNISNTFGLIFVPLSFIIIIYPFMRQFCCNFLLNVTLSNELAKINDR